MIWKTHCGYFINDNSRHFYNIYHCMSMHYMGVEYCPENKNVAIVCPFKEPCDKAIFKSRVRLPNQCPTFPVDEPYDYELSLEKVHDEIEQKYYRKLDKFRAKHPGARFCMCLYSDRFGNLKGKRDLSRCAAWGQHGCENDVCCLTGKKRSLDLVNIYYDICEVEVSGFFRIEKWQRNIKFFNHPVVRAIAEEKLKEIEAWGTWEAQAFRGVNKLYNLHISNRPGKDLLADLRRVAEQGQDANHVTMSVDVADPKKERLARLRAVRAKRAEAGALKLKERARAFQEARAGEAPVQNSFWEQGVND